VECATGIRTAIQDITERKRAEDQVRQTSDELARLVRQLEEKNRQNTILSELRGFLIACSSGDEIGPVAARAMSRLSPDSAGALLLLGPSKTDLESVARWGGYPEEVDENLFAPDACWGLRRGSGHVVDDVRTGLVCLHVRSAAEGGYGCLPLTARSEVLGLLHVRTAANGTEEQGLRAIQLKDGVKGLRVSYAGRELGPVTLSMGVSAFPASGDSPQDLLRAADEALYKAKQAGRDRVVLVEEGSHVDGGQPGDAVTP